MICKIVFYYKTFFPSSSDNARRAQKVSLAGSININFHQFPRHIIVLHFKRPSSSSFDSSDSTPSLRDTLTMLISLFYLFAKLVTHTRRWLAAAGVENLIIMGSKLTEIS